MARITDKELKGYVERINSLLDVETGYNIKGSITLSHRYGYRAIDQFTGNHCDTSLMSGMSARECKMYLLGILAGFTLKREQADREKALLAIERKQKECEGFSNYETAMVGLYIANDSKIAQFFHGMFFSRGLKLTYQNVYLFISKHYLILERDWSLSGDWLEQVNIRELVDHFNEIWSDNE